MMLSGRWTFRILRNDPTLVGDDPAAALGLILGEGVLDIEQAGPGGFRGGLGFADGRALALEGRPVAAADGAPADYAIEARGIAGSATQGWRYACRCRPGHRWPEAAGQVDSLVGTMIRLDGPGGDDPAGCTGAFVAVRQGEMPPGRPPPRRNVLTAGI